MNKKIKNKKIANIKKSLLGLFIVPSIPLLGLSAVVNQNSNNVNKNTLEDDELTLKEGANINNIKVWKMEKNFEGKKLENSYYGLILPLGTSITKENIRNLFKNSKYAYVSFDKTYDKNKEGTYSASIFTKQKKLRIKIFLTGKNFDFPKGVSDDNVIFSIRPFSYVTLPKYFSIPSNVKTIGSHAFSQTILNDDFKIPNGVTTIGQGAFDRARLNDDFKIPNGITTIKAETFTQAKLNDSFKIPDSVTKIDKQAFAVTSLPTNFKLPNSITYIGNEAFWATSLNESFTIPDSVTEIEEHAFRETILNWKFRLPKEIKKYKKAFSDTKMGSTKIDWTLTLKSVKEINEKLNELEIINELTKKFINSNKGELFDDNLLFAVLSKDKKSIYNWLNQHYDKNKVNFTKDSLDQIINKIDFKEDGIHIKFRYSLHSSEYDSFKDVVIGFKSIENIPLFKNIASTSKDNLIKEFNKDRFYLESELKDADIISKIKNIIVSKIDNEFKGNPSDIKKVKDIFNSFLNIKLVQDPFNKSISIKIQLGQNKDYIYKEVVIDVFKDPKTYNNDAKIVVSNDNNSSSNQEIYNFDKIKHEYTVLKQINTNNYQSIIPLAFFNEKDKESYYKINIEDSKNAKTNEVNAPYKNIQDINDKIGKNQWNKINEKTIKYDPTTINDGDIAYSTPLDSNKNKNNINIVWKNVKNGWMLLLKQKNVSGTNSADAIYRFKITKTTKPPKIASGNKYLSFQPNMESAINKLTDQDFKNIFNKDRLYLDSELKDADIISKIKNIIVSKLGTNSVQGQAFSNLFNIKLILDNSDIKIQIKSKESKKEFSKNIVINGLTLNPNYNSSYKIVASNDDNNGNSKEFYKFDQATNTYKILKPINTNDYQSIIPLAFFNKNDDQSYYKINIEDFDNAQDMANGTPYKSIQEIEDKIKGKKWKIEKKQIFQYNQSSIKDGDVLYSTTLETSNGNKTKNSIKIVWKKVNNGWMLLLKQKNQNIGGDDDAIYRFNVTKLFNLTKLKPVELGDIKSEFKATLNSLKDSDFVKLFNKKGYYLKEELKNNDFINKIKDIIVSKIVPNSKNKNIVEKMLYLLNINLIQDPINNKIVINIQSNDNNLKTNKEIAINNVLPANYNDTNKIVFSNDDNNGNSKEFYKFDQATNTYKILKPINTNDYQSIIPLAFFNKNDGQSRYYINIEDFDNAQDMANGTPYKSIQEIEDKIKGKKWKIEKKQIFQYNQSSIKDGDVLYSTTLETSNGNKTKNSIKIVWKKVNNGWMLLLKQKNQNTGGDDDAIYRFNITKLNSGELDDIKSEFKATLNILKDSDFVKLFNKKGYYLKEELKNNDFINKIKDIIVSKIDPNSKNKNIVKMMVYSLNINWIQDPINNKIVINIQSNDNNLKTNKEIAINNVLPENYNDTNKIVVSNDLNLISSDGERDKQNSQNIYEYDETKNTYTILKPVNTKNQFRSFQIANNNSDYQSIIPLAFYGENIKKLYFRLSMNDFKDPNKMMQKNSYKTSQDIKSKIDESQWKKEDEWIFEYNPKTIRDGDVLYSTNLKTSNGGMTINLIKLVWKKVNNGWMLLLTQRNEIMQGEDDAIYKFNVSNLKDNELNNFKTQIKQEIKNVTSRNFDNLIDKKRIYLNEELKNNDFINKIKNIIVSKLNPNLENIREVRQMVMYLLKVELDLDYLKGNINIKVKLNDSSEELIKEIDLKNVPQNYNETYKIIASNDDNYKNGQDIYEFNETKNTYTILKPMNTNDYQIIAPLAFYDKNNNDKYYLYIEGFKNAEDMKESKPYKTAQDINSKIDENKWENIKNEIELKIPSDLKDGDVAYSTSLKTSNGNKSENLIKIIWKKINNGWMLLLKQKNQNISGDDDAIYRFSIKEESTLTKEADQDILLAENDIKNSINKISSILDGKENILPSSLSSKSKPEEFGFKTPNSIPKNVKVTYSFKKANDQKGEVIIEAKISEKHGKSRVIDFALKGFHSINGGKKSNHLSKTAIALITVFSLASLVLSGFGLQKYLKKRKRKNS